MENITIESFLLFCYCWIAIAVITFVALLFIRQPYGRHVRKGFGYMINNKLGWLVMEIISPIAFNFFFLHGNTMKTPLHWLFFAIFNLHYLNRSIIFPLRTNTKGKKIPLSIVLSAIVFNCVNGFINGFYLGNFQNSNPTIILIGIGITLFLIGFYINNRADSILIALRKDGSTDYKIPHGFLFEKITCPNYLGEILEWLGFFIMTMNIASFTFLIWSLANLIPRARDHHAWYVKTFKEYPSNRRVIFPYLF